MAILSDRSANYMVDYEDSDASFGNDAISQNQALINFINKQPNPFNSNSNIIEEPLPFESTQNLIQDESPPPEPPTTGVFGLPIAPVQSPAITTSPKTPAAPAKVDYTSALAKQILGQGLTSKWSGEGFGSADANAADMAKILAGIGITDIKQFGKFTQTGIQTEVRPDGSGGFLDDKGNPVDPSIVKSEYQSGEAGDTTTYTAPVGTQEVFGNKVTKQAVPNTYSERQTGNFFGGTFSGKGNTGYGVKFDAQGNPIFYTQGASSSDIGQIAPLLTMASFIPGVAPFAQGLNALIAAKQGNILGAALSAFGAAGAAGFTDIAGIPINDAKNVLGGINALKTGNVAGIINSAANYAGASLPSELGTGIKIFNAANAFSKGDIAGLLDAASSLTGSSDAKLAASALRFTNAFKSGDPSAFMNAAQAFGNVANVASANPKLALGFGPGDPDDFSAGLIPGYFQPGGDGYIPPDGEDPVTVQQQPSDLDDFLKQLEQYKQAAVTPDDIQKIISGKNYATPEDVQTMLNTIDIPKGMSEQDVQVIISNAFADNPGIKIDDVQSVVNAAVSKIPTGVSQDELTRSLGTSEQNILSKVGAQGEQFQTLFDQYQQLGMDADAALRQTIDDLGTDVGSQIADVQTGLGSQISQQGEEFQTLLQQYRDLGLDENTALMQTIDDLESNVGGQFTDVKGQIADVQTGLGSQISQQGEQFQTLLQQYRDLGMDENDAIRQTIDDLGSTFGEQLSGLESGLSGQFSKQSEQFQTLLQQYRDLGLDENDALRQTIDDLGADVSGQFSGLESKLTETQTGVDELAQSLGKTREELLAEFELSEQETAKRIADLESEFGGQLTESTKGIESKITGLEEDFSAQLAESLGTTKEDLLDQLGVTEEEINQRIADLESEFGGSFENIESSLGKTREELLSEFGVTEDEINQRIADLETEFGGNFEDIESSLGKTREELLAEFGLSEEETAQRIADLETEFGGQLTSGLGKQSAETKALFQNLFNKQQAQEKAAATQNAALNNALSQVQSTGDFNTLMSLLSSQQQPVQQAPMQDPYADIKLMEDLFGSEIDLTPAGDNTARRK